MAALGGGEVEVSSSRVLGQQLVESARAGPGSTSRLSPMSSRSPWTRPTWRQLPWA